MAMGRRLPVIESNKSATHVGLTTSRSAILSGTLCMIVAVVVPETYGPLLLKRRAQALSRRTGDIYVSKLAKDETTTSLRSKLRIAMSRPWLMLIREPIVLFLTIYLALLYGTVAITSFFG